MTHDIHMIDDNMIHGTLYMVHGTWDMVHVGLIRT